MLRSGRGVSQPKAGAPRAAAGVTECEAVSIGGDRLSLYCQRAGLVSELRDDLRLPAF